MLKKKKKTKRRVRTQRIKTFKSRSLWKKPRSLIFWGNSFSEPLREQRPSLIYLSLQRKLWAIPHLLQTAYCSDLYLFDVTNQLSHQNDLQFSTRTIHYIFIDCIKYSTFKSSFLKIPTKYNNNKKKHDNPLLLHPENIDLAVNVLCFNCMTAADGKRPPSQDFQSTDTHRHQTHQVEHDTVEAFQRTKRRDSVVEFLLSFTTAPLNVKAT